MNLAATPPVSCLSHSCEAFQYPVFPGGLGTGALNPARITLPEVWMGFPGGSVGKESACNAGDAGDTGLTPGSGRSPGGGHGHPLQYSCLENPMGRGAWSAMVHRVTNRETCLKPWIIVSVDKTISLRPGTGRTPFTWKIYSLLSGAQRGQHVLLASAVSQVPLIQNNPPKWYIWDGVFCCPQVHSLVTAPDIQTV